MCPLVRGSGDDHPGGTQQPTIEAVAALHREQHGPRLGRGRGLGGHCLVLMGIEGLPGRVEFGDADALERFLQEAQRGRLPLGERRRIRASRVLDRKVEAVLHRQQFLCEPLDAETVRLFDIALGALADVVELGDRTQVLVALLLAARLGIGEQRLEIVQRQTLARLGGGRGFSSRACCSGAWNGP